MRLGQCLESGACGRVLKSEACAKGTTGVNERSARRTERKQGSQDGRNADEAALTRNATESRSAGLVEIESGPPRRCRWDVMWSRGSLAARQIGVRIVTRRCPSAGFVLLFLRNWSCYPAV